ncbi:MAG: hypothetical protein A2Y21_07900 [Clostridiales bacterium GWC2_40_7]|nr:MAG: hypothetical protein A2Y21_07900 [Clostridiales bacterium GWC2_40_7]
MINTQQINMINYMVVCINEFASRYNLSSKEAFDYLSKYSGISFLKDNYEIEHTLSIDDAIDDMIIICGKNGGCLS